MEGIYNIYLGETCIGQAEVRREGLYYRFVCRCRLTGESLYKIVLTCGEQKQTLGTPIPSGQEFILHRKLPAKQFLNGEICFCAIPKEDGIFVPIRSEEPFPYLSALKTARLECRNGQIGIVLRKE